MSESLVRSFGTTGELANLFSDASVLAALLEFESALARAQAKLGMIPAAAAEAIARAAVAHGFDPDAIAREARKSATLMVPLVSALAARLDPPYAAFVHRGATSQDAIDTAMVLLLGRARPLLGRDHGALEARLRALSEEHAATVMLARTLLQPAPPITFGYKVAGWYGAVHRSWARVESRFAEALWLQFGGAAGTLASYGEQGPALAGELARELAIPVTAPWHAHRDRIAALVAACGIYTGALGKMARDIALLMQQEVGEVAEAGGGSSAMPNKRNPSGCAIALAAAVRMPGLVAAMLGGMVQEHERAAGGWQAEWQTVVDTVETTGSALAAIRQTLDGLTVYPDRMRANIEATRGAIYAERAAMVLGPKMGREQARELLAKPGAEALACTGIEGPEDYLGSAEWFRKKLLEE